MDPSEHVDATGRDMVSRVGSRRSRQLVDVAPRGAQTRSSQCFEPMRFCFISTQQDWGGGEALCADLSLALRDHGHGIHWICRGGTQVAAHLSQLGLSIDHTLLGRGRSLREIRAVSSLFRQISPDALVMNDTHAVPLGGLATWWARSRRPVRLAFKHTVFPLRSKLKYRWLCDRVVCVSQAARQTILAGGMDPSRVEVVYGGIRPPGIDPTARNEVRRELGLLEGTSLVLSVGNLLECKGHAELVQAVAALPPSIDAVFCIAGEGPVRTALQSRIDALGLGGRVRLLGFRRDVSRLMQAADLIVHPSHLEGLSLVLIEAQMLRRPIVATAVGGAAEVLAAGRAPGLWTVPPHSSQALAQALSAAWRSLNDPMQREPIEQHLSAAAAHVQSHFTIEQSARHLADLAARLAGD
ncbi:MAG: glycosyltransferase [Planctomycetota bacterium]|nr:MAG: glycosyltransferase [Planctomycetota bacterium]